MKDLKTLLSSDATDFERQLLGAMAEERPSPELQLRMQQALGLGPVALQGSDASLGGPEMSGPPAAVKTAAGAGWAARTWIQVVLAVGAGAGLVAGGLAIRSSEPAPLTRASPPVPEQPAQAAPVEAPTPNVPSAAVSHEPVSIEPVSIEPMLREPMSRELREEIELLDRVRTALDQHDARAASALLDSYANRFPEGRLAREASVLRTRTGQVARTAR